MVTICFIYFRSLTLANLRAALFSLRQQDFAQVAQIIFLDNNTPDEKDTIHDVIAEFDFPVPVTFISDKHGDPTKTHSWSTNFLHRAASTPWVFFTRADYILAPNTLALFLAEARHDRQFIIGGYYGLDVDISVCDSYDWRTQGPTVLHHLGKEYGHVMMDVGGVWLTTRAAYESVGGLDERLWAWGHQQTLFQFKMHEAGIEFVRVPQVVFYHAEHAYEVPRDHGTAIAQLHEVGGDIKQIWARYDSPDNPYKS